MIIYVFLLLFVLIGTISSAKYKRMMLGFSFLFIACILGLRDVSVGIDTITYYEKFLSIAKDSWSVLFSDFYYGSIEIGYALFLKVCYSINSSFYFSQIVFAIIFSVLWYRILSRQKYCFFGLILFLAISIFLPTMNISRQMLAVTITTVAWEFILKNKIKLAFLLWAIAVTIHTSSVLFLIPMVLYLLPYNKWVYRILPLSAIVVIVLFPILFASLSNLLVKYSSYLDNQKQTQEANLAKIIWCIVVLISIVIIYNNKLYKIRQRLRLSRTALFQCKKNSYSIHKEMNLPLRKSCLVKKQLFNKEEKIAALCSILFVSCNIIGLQFNYFERVGLCFLPFWIIIFISIKKIFDRIKLGRIYLVCTGFCFAVYFLLSATAEQYQYKFFF